MRRLGIVAAINLVLLIGSVFLIVSCGNSNRGNNNGTINGRVLDVFSLVKYTPTREKSVFEKFKTVLNPIPDARAQTGVPGIEVQLISPEGFIQATTVTGNDGNFNFSRVEARNNYEIRFLTSPALSIIIDVVKNSNVILDVDLNLIGQSVIIENYEFVVNRPITLVANETFVLDDSRITRFSVNGQAGRSCIRATDFTVVDIDVGGSIEMIGCQDAVVGLKRSDISLSADGIMTILISANQFGIIGEGDTVIVLDSPDIRVTGGQTGIFARNNAVVSLLFSDTCIVEGLQNIAVETLGLADVNVEGCTLIDGI